MSINNINKKIAVTATDLMGTMGTVYFFFFLVMIPLVFPTLMTPIMYISSSIIQLVVLPLIMVGQQVQGEKTEIRAIQDHETLMAELAEIKEIHSTLNQLHKDKAGCGYVSVSS